jgi:monoamine oxidase
VQVELKDGTVLECDYVIVTVPLGVLKHKDIAFDPELPPWKVKAIDRFGMGLENKIILGFSECFWPENVQVVICVVLFAN